MNVFVTGASGFIGTYVVRALCDAGHAVRALYRRDPEEIASAVTVVRGSITEPASLQGAMEGCDAVVHLVGIIEEQPDKGITFDLIHNVATHSVVGEAKRAGVSAFVFMSANGAREDGVSAYQVSKWRGQQHVAGAGFDRWTIFRPSLVFGDPGPGKKDFAVELADKLIKPFPILPVFGKGQYEMQPIHVADLATAVAASLDRATPGGRSYNVGGREKLPYTEIVDRITSALGLKSRPKIHQPIWLARKVIRTAARTGLLPISIDQFEMLIEGNTCDASAFFADFDVSGTPFTVEELAYVKQRTD